MRYIFTFLLLLSSVAFANTDTVQTIGSYQIHYSTLNTSFLSADVARAYGITRGKDKALLNVAVLKKQSDGRYLPVQAKVAVELYDLIHKNNLPVQEVIEEYAIYYLSPFNIDHKVTVYFTVTAEVADRKTPLKIQFKRKLYKDDQ